MEQSPASTTKLSLGLPVRRVFLLDWLEFADPSTLVLLAQCWGSQPAEIVLWDIHSNRACGTIPLPYVPDDLAVSPSSQVAATRVASGRIDLWDLQSRSHLGRMTVTEIVNDNVFRGHVTTSDRTQFVTYCEGAELFPGDSKVNSRPPTKTAPTRITIGNAGLLSAMSKDGRFGAILHSQNRLEVIDLSGRTVVTGIDTLDFGWNMAFSPDSRSLALGHHNTGAIEIRDVESGELQALRQIPRNSVGAPHYGVELGYAPNGSWVVATNHHSVAVWETSQYRLTHKLTENHRHPFVAILFVGAFVGWSILWARSSRSERSLAHRRAEEEEPGKMQDVGQDVKVSRATTIKCLGLGIAGLTLGVWIVYLVISRPWLAELAWYDASWELAFLLALELWLLTFATIFALLAVSSRLKRRVVLINDGLPLDLTLSLRYVLPTGGQTLACRSLIAAGIMSICWSVGLIFLSKLDVYQVSSYIGIATGVYALATATSGNSRRLGTAATGIGLSVLNGNVISLGLGAVALWHAQRRDVAVGVVSPSMDSAEVETSGLPIVHSASQSRPVVRNAN